MPRFWAWFSDPSPARRAVAVAVLVVACLAVVRGFALVVRFPDGYNGAQSATADRLAAEPGRWEDWRGGAARDLALFVPGFVALGAAALAWAVPGRRLRVAAVSSLVAAGAADVVETVLFRGTLDRLLGGAAAADLATRTAVTRGFTVAKYGGFALVGLALLGVVAGAGRRR